MKYVGPVKVRPPFDPGQAFLDAEKISNDWLRSERLERKAQRQSVKWYCKVQGSCVEVIRQLPLFLCPLPPTKKKVGPMSRQSRMNLLRFVNRIDWSKVSSTMFLTLTYPDSVYRESYAERSRDRFVFLRYMEAHLASKVASLWRVEWMPRRTGKFVGKMFPHFHLLLFDVFALEETLVRESWRKTIRHDDTYLSVKVKPVYGEMGAVKYISKYVSKAGTLDIRAFHNSDFPFGRSWGVTRKHLIPLCPIAVLKKLSKEEVEFAKRYAEETFPQYDAETGGGFTLLSPIAAEMFRDRLIP